MANKKMVYVSDELHKRIRLLAAEHSVTIGELVELAIKKLESEK